MPQFIGIYREILAEHGELGLRSILRLGAFLCTIPKKELG